MRLALPLLLLAVLSACAGSQKQTENIDNISELGYPSETTNLVLVRDSVYENPLLGIGLSYRDKINATDLITVYVYPIQQKDWSEQQPLLLGETARVIAEVDYLIEQGRYQSRTEPELSEFTMQHDERIYRGVKSAFQLTLANGDRFDSESFVFIEGDKFIKFRTSFNKDYTPDWSGDPVVEELLPELVVPPESDYMKLYRMLMKVDEQ